MLKSLTTDLEENETSQFLQCLLLSGLKQRKQSKSLNGYKLLTLRPNETTKKKLKGCVLAAYQISGSAKIITQIAAYSPESR